jgi:alkylated DNA repair dioxygenase AlkB
MISGLKIVNDYINAPQQHDLLTTVDEALWLTDLSRRVQHYGYKYDYKRRRIDPDLYVGPLPPWAARLATRLHAEGHTPTLPDQCIVNEYEPGQGISAHVDCEPCFGDVICSVSLGSGCMMVFQHGATGEKREAYLKPGSLVVMRDESRYLWTHAIPARKTDRLNGQRVARGRRVSLTFRTVILGE